MDRKIKKLLDILLTRKRTLATKIRSIVLSVDKKITEGIKWGNLTFIYKCNMASIGNYDTVDYLNFFFFKATKLRDPKGLLEGTGKGMRHVKIKSKKNIDELQIRPWIRQAMKLNE